MREICYTETFSYGQLRHTLSRLSFEQHTGRNEFDVPIRAFYHRETGAMFAVPDKPDAAPLEPIYLRIAERAVEDWGVAENQDFFKLLHEAAQKEPQAA